MEDFGTIIGMGMGGSIGIGAIQSYKYIKILLQAYQSKPSRIATADIMEIFRLGRAVHEWDKSQWWYNRFEEECRVCRDALPEKIKEKLDDMLNERDMYASARNMAENNKIECYEKFSWIGFFMQRLARRRMIKEFWKIPDVDKFLAKKL